MEVGEGPVYTNENIFVFVLPVVFMSPRGEAAGTSKRKRKDSPERFSKRLLNQYGADQLVGDIMATTELLRKAALRLISILFYWTR